MKREHAVFSLVVFCNMLVFIACTNERTAREKQIAYFFPTANRFVLKTPTLSTEHITSLESTLGKKLRTDDLTPTFHIATAKNGQPLGTVLFLEIGMPHGILSGGIGLNMQGKIVGINIYKLNIPKGEFLVQFVGKNIEDAFEVGADVIAIPGQKKLSQAIANFAKKGLVLTHTLFPKKTEAVRIDTGRRYTISQLTKAVIGHLNGVVTIDVYYSRAPTQFAERRRKIWDLLKEYRAFSNNLQMRMVDPIDLDAAEKEALTSRGITELQVKAFHGYNNEVANIYMSVVVAYDGREEILPIIEDTNTFEHNLTSAILKLTADEVSESPPAEAVEPETLIELMDMMKEPYDILREYFQTRRTRHAALNSAKTLARYIKFVDYFEPPINADQTEEYAYFQKQVATALHQLISALESEGHSDNATQRWEELLDWVDKAHLRFSIHEVDLDEDLN